MNKEKLDAISNDLIDYQSKFFELESVVKSTGLRLADDWGLFFMRVTTEYEDELYVDTQLALVIVLYMTWQQVHGYSAYLNQLEKELKPHGVTREEIERALKKMERVKLIGRDKDTLGATYYCLNRDMFAKTIGVALGIVKELGEEVEKGERLLSLSNDGGIKKKNKGGHYE